MAIAPVVIEFLAKGVPQVQQAFKSIQDAAIRAERAQVVEVEKGERAKATSTEKWAKYREKLLDKSATMAGRFYAKQAREEAAAAKRASRATISESEKTTAAIKKGEHDRARAVRDRVNETKQAEKDLDAWQRRASQQRRQEAREEARVAREARRVAEKEERESRRVGSVRGRAAEAVLGAGARGVIAGLQRSGGIAQGLATTAAQLGGGFSIADSVGGEQRMRQQAATLSASTILSRAGTAGAEENAGKAMSTDEVLSKAKAIGISQGINPEEVLAGFDEIKKLAGNLSKATEVMPAVAKLATATGSDLSVTSRLAGNIIGANPNISSDDLDKQMRIFTHQGAVGGVEIEDFARYGSRITAGATKYGGNRETNEVTLGAMAQMSRQYGGAASPAEAALGAQRFGEDVIKHADDLKGMGITVSDGKGNLKDAQAIILEMLAKTGGDVTKVSHLNLGARGSRPLEGAAAIYKDAGGGESGLEAVKKEFKKYGTGVSKEEVDAANRRVLAERKVEMSMQALRIAAGEQLLPEFIKIIPTLKELIPAFVEVAKVGIPAFSQLMKTVADFVEKNKGLVADLAAHPVGTLIAFELTKSFAAAGLPALIRALFSGAFGGGVGGGGGSAAFALGKAAPALARNGAAAAMVATAGALGGSVWGGMTAYADASMEAEDVAAKVRAWGQGDRSRGIDPAAAANAIEAAKGRLSQTSGLEKLGLGIGGAFSDEYEQRYQQNKKDQALVDAEDLRKAITEAAAAGVREGVASGMSSMPGNNSGPNGAGRSKSIIER